MAAKKPMRIRTRTQEGQIEVQILIPHPMETGQRTDKQTKQKIPAHFIQQVTVEHNGKFAVQLNTGAAVSEDPLFGFRLKDAKNGDKLKVTWSDNKGASGSGETVVEG
ncbi:MAG: thiosulfate oxidation carrier complex protein SoxZ [Pseudomonadota bacterium]|nr:MAG: thiosulfate oxidation carrier complex protein SoxZ [Pseudomonadota bacterium]